MMKTVFHFASLLMIGLLCVMGCEQEETPEIINSQPTIDRVIVPKEVNAGDTVRLEVVAHDLDGDPLTYRWVVTAGTVDSGGVWSVPLDATSAAVLVHVSDGINSPVSGPQSNVKIIKPAPVPPPPPPALPPPTVPVEVEVPPVEATSTQHLAIVGAKIPWWQGNFWENWSETFTFPGEIIGWSWRSENPSGEAFVEKGAERVVGRKITLRGQILAKTHPVSKLDVWVTATYIVP